MSRSKMEVELKHLRSSLHEAHRELALKSERIAELEAALKKNGEVPLESVLGETSETDDRNVEVASKKALLEGERPGVRKVDKVTPDELSSSTDSEPEKSLEIFYSKNSAVSYDGREQILNFVREELEARPIALFSITGYANDSSYEETDQDIAHNRTRFLIDYLTIRGVPDEAFANVESEASSETGNEGRKLVIRTFKDH